MHISSTRSHTNPLPPRTSAPNLFSPRRSAAAARLAPPLLLRNIRTNFQPAQTTIRFTSSCSISVCAMMCPVIMRSPRASSWPGRRSAPAAARGIRRGEEAEETARPHTHTHSTKKRRRGTQHRPTPPTRKVYSYRCVSLLSITACAALCRRCWSPSAVSGTATARDRPRERAGERRGADHQHAHARTAS